MDADALDRMRAAETKRAEATYRSLEAQAPVRERVDRLYAAMWRSRFELPAE
jgi:hypothetical protein